VKRRQFEGILDECISAYLSGRRSVEASLSLYPSIARELGPLLRAAADTADTFQEMSVPAHVQARIRQRILQAANERAAARSLTRAIDGFAQPTRSRSHWLLAIPALAVVSAAIVAAGIAFWNGGSEEGSVSIGDVSVVEHPEFAKNVSSARRQLDALRTKAGSGRAVTAAEIEALLLTTRRLGQTPEPSMLSAPEQAAVEQILEEQIALLGQLTDASNEDSEELEAAVETTVSVAALFGVALDGADPDASPAGAPTATDPAGSSSDVSPAPSPTSAPSATATPSSRD
jgi:hypothetical protein